MPPNCTPEKCKENDILHQKFDGADNVYYNCKEKAECEFTNELNAQDPLNNLLSDIPQLADVFNLHSSVGDGTFSTVYLATLKSDETEKHKFAVKHIVPTCHPDRIKFELKCLQQIGGNDNVVGVELCLRGKHSVAFVMPYHHHQPFSEYVGQMDADELACYMKNLLKAVARVHQFGIIHRDIKPSNFLYDRNSRRYLLVDFGLAQPILPEGQTCRKSSDGAMKRKRVSGSPQGEENQRIKRPALQNRDLNTLNVDFKSNNLLNRKNKENNPNYGNILNINTHSNSSFVQTIETSQKLPLKCQPLGLHMENVHTAGIDLAKRRLFNDSIQKPIIKVKKYCGGLSKTQATNNANIKESAMSECKCYGKPKVCSKCLLKKALQAARAGTPGYRPPEVLLKYPYQTTAVDIWAVGVIMLCILSNSVNFFQSPNDIIALAEMVSLFGFNKIQRVAQQCGRYFTCSEKKTALDLRQLCCNLRNRKKSKAENVLQSTSCSQLNLSNSIQQDKKNVSDIFPSAAYDLLQRLLDVNPVTRISAETALQHPFFNNVHD